MAELLRVPPGLPKAGHPILRGATPGGPHRGGHNGKVRNGGFMLGKWKMIYFFLEDVGYYVRIFLEENVK